MAKTLTLAFRLVSFPFIFPGWGRTIGGGNAADVLQQALLPVADHKTCRKKMKVLGKVYKAPMLCAGAQGKGGCQVDSKFLISRLMVVKTR